MMSVSSTCRNTPSSSPKSPPNRLLLVHLQSFYLYPPSPNVELADIKEFKEQLKLQGVFINREPEHKGEFWNLLCFDKILDRLIGVAGDWREEWRSRPNSIPPRAWIAQVDHHFFFGCIGRPSFFVFFWLHRSTIIFVVCFFLAAQVDHNVRWENKIICFHFRGTEKWKKRRRRGTTGCFSHL